LSTDVKRSTSRKEAKDKDRCRKRRRFSKRGVKGPAITMMLSGDRKEDKVPNIANASRSETTPFRRTMRRENSNGLVPL